MQVYWCYFLVMLVLCGLCSCADPHDQQKSKNTPINESSNQENHSDESLDHEEQEVEVWSQEALNRINDSALGKLLNNEGFKKNLVDWNQSLPKDTSEWMKLLGGDTQKVSGMLVPFSFATEFTSLEKPRVVLTAPESSEQKGRIFIAISELENHARKIEFISWNTIRGAFDFGIIEEKNQQRRVVFANEATCFACHRTRSPIFPDASWDNTVINRAVMAAFIKAQDQLDTPQFSQLNQKLDIFIQKDTQARVEFPPLFDDYIDALILEDDFFAKAVFDDFPFVDADLEQAFDFNQAIFDAHTLVVATDWLQTLPNQHHAASIVRDQAFHLIDKHPNHYKTLATFKSPYLSNFNLVSGKPNKFHSLDSVIPSIENIEAVAQYNSKVKKSKKHVIPSSYRATAASAFHAHPMDWRDYLTEDMIQNAFKDREWKSTQKKTESLDNEIVPHEKLCSSCHDGSKSSPVPDYSSFNPLIEGDWIKFLNDEQKSQSNILCDTLARINSIESPMPPAGTKESHSFFTFKDSVVLSLHTLVERFSIDCQFK